MNHLSTKGKILVVEDEKNWRRRLKKILDLAHYQTMEAETHVRAIELLEIHDDIDVVVTDLHLDREIFSSDHFRGWDILQTIQRLYPRNPIQTIIITGFPETYVDLREKKKLWANFFMEKAKFEPTLLLQLIEKALRQKRELQREKSIPTIGL